MPAGSWVALAIVVVMAVWAIAVFNRLVQRRNRIANAFAQIDVQLKRRYDLVPNLVEVARRYLAHEAATLEAVEFVKAGAEIYRRSFATIRGPGDVWFSVYPSADPRPGMSKRSWRC